MDQPPHEVEREWIVAIAGGDRTALAQLYARYAPAELALGLRVLRSREDAEDLVNDLFVEVFKRAGDFDPQRGVVRTWLMVRARSRALDRLRRAGIRERVLREAPAVLEPPALPTPVASYEHRRLRDAVAELPEVQREVLTLSYFEGLTSQEIAHVQQVPIGTVKSRAAAARQKLRAVIESEEEPG
jgi:RNA polymerase sigma-70 factor (ECF subfamily)